MVESNPVLTSSAGGGAKGCSDHRLCAPPTYSAQLEIGFSSNFFSAFQSYYSLLSDVLLSYNSRSTLDHRKNNWTGLLTTVTFYHLQTEGAPLRPLYKIDLHYEMTPGKFCFLSCCLESILEVCKLSRNPR